MVVHQTLKIFMKLLAAPPLAPFMYLTDTINIFIIFSRYKILKISLKLFTVLIKKSTILKKKYI